MSDVSLLEVLRRWWKVLLAGALVAGVAGYLVASSLPKTYEGEVQMLVGPINTDIALEASGAMARTYAELARSRPALAFALQRTREDAELRDFEEDVATTSNEITRIVSIRVEHGDPGRAALLANTLAGHVVGLSRQRSPSTTAAIEEFLSQPEITPLPRSQVAEISQAAERVLGPSVAGRVRVVDPATPPESAVRPMVPLLVALAVLAGMGVAAGIALMLDARGRRRLDERALDGLDADFLGTVVTSSSTDPGVALPVRADPMSASADGYRALAARLELARGGPPGTLLVVDAHDGATAGMVAANLASVLAQGGRRVLLVDVDGDGATVTRLFGLEGRPGAGELLDDADEEALNGRLGDFAGRVDDDLWVMPRGASASRLPSARRAAAALDRVRASVDQVIVSGPALARSPAALVWATAADRTLLVADATRSSQEAVGRALRELRQVGGGTAGLVLGCPARRRVVP